jgi:hypothetical protein
MSYPRTLQSLSLFTLRTIRNALWAQYTVFSILKQAVLNCSAVTT